MNYKLLLLILFILLGCSSESPEIKSKAEQAENLFSKGNLQEAYQLYQELENAGIKNSLIYERMADSSSDLGLKTFYLRKASQLDCTTCRDKLESIRTSIKFSPILKSEPAISNNLRAILILLFSTMLGISILSFNYVSIKLFLLSFIPSCLATLWISLGTYCGSDYPPEIESCVIRGKRIYELEAIITKDESFALSTQDPQSQAILALPKGAEIIITDIDNSWAQLRLPNNRTGWIMTENLKLLN